MIQSFNLAKKLFIFALLATINSLSAMERKPTSTPLFIVKNNPRHEVESLQRHIPKQKLVERKGLLYLSQIKIAVLIKGKKNSIRLPLEILVHIASFLKLPSKKPAAALEEWVWRNHPEELKMLEEIFKSKLRTA